MGKWLGRSARGAATLVIAVTGGVPDARAGEPNGSDLTSEEARAAVERASARASMVRGDEAFAAGRFQEALDAYRTADRLVGVPTTALATGRALLAMGRLVEAQDALLRAVRYPVTDASPTALFEARDHAAELVRGLEPRLPAVEVNVRPASARPTLRVDGVAMPISGNDAIFRIDPGTHRVQIAAPGHATATRMLAVAEGEHKTMRVQLPRRLSLEDVPMATWVSAGLSGTALVTGAVTGLASYLQTQSLRERCEGALCDASLQSDFDRAHLLARVANAAFIVSGVGAVAGLVSLVKLPSIEDADVKVDVSLGGLRLRHDF